MSHPRLQFQRLTDEYFGLKGINMRNRRIGFLLAIILLGFTSNNLFAQWSEFKKGLRKEVQIAVESDTMLVAHHNAINFSFIVTTNKTSGSDIYRDMTTDEKSQGRKIWKTTERFWERLRKARKSIKLLFAEPFLEKLHHPDFALIDGDSTEINGYPISSKGIGAKNIAHPKSLVERIQEAKSKGDFEVASLLLIMLKEKNIQSSDTTTQQAQEELQQQFRQEKAVLEKLYTFAYEYEQAGDWKMAAAVYENLLEFGEYKDARSRLEVLLTELQQVTDDQVLRKKYKAGLTAVALQEWENAFNIFEDILTIQPDYRNARARLLEAKAALEKPDSQKADFYANGHTREYDLEEKILPERSDFTDESDNIQQNAESFLENNTASKENKFAPQYNDALQKISIRDWANAHYILKMIESEKPAYKNTSQLLRLVEANMSPRWGYLIYGAGGLIVFVTFAGLIIFSLDFRAGIYSLFRQYKRAAEIYKRQLAVNPGRLKIYGNLGVAYFKSGRDDAEAIRVYAMIEKLNLQIKHRGQIRAFLKNLSSNQFFEPD